MVLALLLGCADDPAASRPTGEAPIVWCEGDTAQRYDPELSVELEQWPDDVWTVEDAASRTGVRVSIVDAPWVAALNPVIAPLAPQLEGASGFHTQGRIVLRFTASLGVVPTGSAASVRSAALQLLDLSTEPATRVPYESEIGEDGRQLRVLPLRPLRPGALHALVATTALQAEDGGCIAPSARLKTWLDGTGDARGVKRHADLLAATGLAAGQISAATVWTTHRDHEGMIEAAGAIQAATLAWTGDAACEDLGGWWSCERSFMSTDYRAASGEVRGAEPAGEWLLPVRILLPPGDGPFPVLVYGHGLNGSRGDVTSMMSQLEGLGVALVAVDALHHGAHPTAGPDSDLAALPFLGLDLEALSIDGLALRGSFEQTTLDRLQLVELLAASPDVDGDGQPDLDASQLGYVGVSLGGLLGPSLLALSDRVQTGVLWVGGGHLISFALDSAVMSTFAPLLETLAGGQAGLDRLLPVAQSAVDPADPALWAALAMEERPFGGAIPDVLLPVALEDEVVPPASARALARGFGLTHLEPVATEVDGLSTAQGPLMANHSSGATAAYFQYDRVSAGDAVEPADHGNTPFAAESEVQLRAWVNGWLDEGRPAAINPYAVVDTPQL
ncbi:MAG: dienelactone hydrolase [Myxococcota bacterium]|jgi:dienelactone hydrolase